MISTADIANKNTPGQVVKRVAPSAGNAVESLFDFFLDIDPDLLQSADIDELAQLYDDLEFMNTVNLNENLHFSRKSSTSARSIARRFYKSNRARILKMSDKLRKNKAAKKRKEIMSKSQRTGEKKRKKKKYPGAKNHVNESSGLPTFSDYLQEDSKGSFRVIKEFVYDSFDGSIDVELNDLLEYSGNQCFLNRQNGDKFKLATITQKDFQWMIENSYIRKLVRRL